MPPLSVSVDNGDIGPIAAAPEQAQLKQRAIELMGEVQRLMQGIEGEVRDGEENLTTILATVNERLTTLEENDEGEGKNLVHELLVDFPTDQVSLEKWISNRVDSIRVVLTRNRQQLEDQLKEEQDQGIKALQRSNLQYYSNLERRLEQELAPIERASHRITHALQLKKIIEKFYNNVDLENLPEPPREINAEANYEALLKWLGGRLNPKEKRSLAGRLHTQAETERQRRVAEEETRRRITERPGRQHSPADYNNYAYYPLAAAGTQKATRSAIKRILLAAGLVAAALAIAARPWKNAGNNEENEESPTPTLTARLQDAEQNTLRAFAVKSAIGTVMKETMAAGRLIVQRKDNEFNAESSRYFDQMHEAIRARLNYTFSREGLEVKSIETMNPQPLHPIAGDMISLDYSVALQDQSTEEMIEFKDTVSFKFE